MRVNQVDWSNYVSQMSSISQKAGEELKKYIEKHGLDDKQVVISFAYDLYKKYASASSALACEMYDEVATLSKVAVPLAETADLYDFKDVAKNINGTIKQNQKPEATMERMVKQAGADTMMKNAKRDRAQWAWIPSGDTCAFCLMLASRGWQYASEKTLTGNHAQHIHAHCDCQFMIRFDNKTNVEGYSPEKYKDMYYMADGDINKLRVMLNNNQTYKKLERGEEFLFDIKTSKLKFNRIVTNKIITYKDNDVYISINAEVKPKDVQIIVKNTNNACKKYNIENYENLKICIVSENELPSVYGQYNAIDDVVYYIDKINDKNFMLYNGEQLKYIEYHEMVHKMQAERFKQKFGQITTDNYANYLEDTRKKAKKYIDSIGIDANNVDEISEYAVLSYDRKFYDEVEAEIRTVNILRKKK